MTGRAPLEMILLAPLALAHAGAPGSGPGALSPEEVGPDPAVGADLERIEPGPLPVAPDTTVVTMTNRLTFEEDTVRIAVGETVVWRNPSDLVHTVTADPERAAKENNVRLPTGVDPFHSGRLAPGDIFRRTFDTPGTYGYFCVPHEGAGMTGVVEVTGP